MDKRRAEPKRSPHTPPSGENAGNEGCPHTPPSGGNVRREGCPYTPPSGENVGKEGYPHTPPSGRNGGNEGYPHTPPSGENDGNEGYFHLDQACSQQFPMATHPIYGKINQRDTTIQRTVEKFETFPTAGIWFWDPHGPRIRADQGQCSRPGLVPRGSGPR